MTEDNIEQSSLEIFAQIGWQVVDGRTIGPDGSGERQFTDVILDQRLKNSLRAINPGFADNIYDEALRKIARSASSDLTLDNYSFHQLLVNGIDIETRQYDGSVRTTKIKIFSLIIEYIFIH